MRSALFLPIFDDLADPRVLAQLAEAAEEAGWNGVFLWDHIRLLEPVRAAHRERIWQLVDDAPRLELAGLGSWAGATGAAGWFLHQSDGGRR